MTSAAPGSALRAWLGPVTPKCDGSQRSRGAAQTVDLLRPILWDRFGITRLAPVTGLDRIGIPVVMAVRPNSRSLAVSQGKGVTLDDARASALMEAVELWHGEQHAVTVRHASWSELRHGTDDTGPAPMDPSRLQLSADTRWHADLVIPWAQGQQLRTGRPVWVPYELVHTDARLPLHPGSGCFSRNSSGLASGNTRAEAALHALCELIERDAGALHAADPAGPGARRVDLESVDHPVARSLLARYADADIAVICWEVTRDIPIPTFQVVISDRSADPHLRPIGAAYGAGTHPDRGIALVRALTEAAQSRLTAISGARDDLTRARVRATQDGDALRHFQALAEQTGRRRFTDAPTVTGATVDDDLDAVLAALAAVGVDEPVVVDLTMDDLPVHVVRVVVPGLEGASSTPSYRPGQRARSTARGGTP